MVIAEEGTFFKKVILLCNEIFWKTIAACFGGWAYEKFIKIKKSIKRLQNLFQKNISLHLPVNLQL